MDIALQFIIAGVVGGLAAGFLGWVESGEPFNGRKFIGTMGRSAVTGLLASLAFQDITDPNLWQFALAFVGGMGIDLLGVTTGIKLE